MTDETGAERLRAQLRRIERLLDPRLLEEAQARVWQSATSGESRWPVSVAVVAAIALQIFLPPRIAFNPRWLLPAIQGLVLLGIVIANPRRIDAESRRIRPATIALIVVSSFANAWSAGRLVVHLVQGTLHQTPAQLLMTGSAIWLTNVVVFALWYWEADRGGPAVRAAGTADHVDFLFPQMATPEFAPGGWQPAFVDYLYTSFTNATAFSPTDVMPLTPWAKVAMMLQSAVSLSTVALVVARAVNVLRG